MWKIGMRFNAVQSGVSFGKHKKNHERRQKCYIIFDAFHTSFAIVRRKKTLKLPLYDKFGLIICESWILCVINWFFPHSIGIRLMSIKFHFISGDSDSIVSHFFRFIILYDLNGMDCCPLQFFWDRFNKESFLIWCHLLYY